MTCVSSFRGTVKALAWLGMTAAMIVGCAADPSPSPKCATLPAPPPSPAEPPEAPAPAPSSAAALEGRFHLASVVENGEAADLEGKLRADDPSMVFVRFEFFFEGPQLSVAMISLRHTGGGGYEACTASFTTSPSWADDSFTMPSIQARGNVTKLGLKSQRKRMNGADVTDWTTDRDNNNCNVSLGGSTYRVEKKPRGEQLQSVALHYDYEGKSSHFVLEPVTEVDLEEVAKAHHQKR